MSGNRGNRLRFSKEEDDKLINSVASSPALYDLKHKFYHDHSVRDDTWDGIARSIGKSVVDCKIRWKSLKDVYRKRKKEIADSSNKKQCRWEHMDALQFLEGVVFSRGAKKADDRDRPEFVTVEEGDGTKDDLADVKIEMDEDDVESEATRDNIATDESDNYSSLGAMVAPPAPRLVEARHPIQIFFDSMARTVMNFPLPLALRTKMEVLEAISKAELELWKEQQAGSSQRQRRPSKY